MRCGETKTNGAFNAAEKTDKDRLESTITEQKAEVAPLHQVGVPMDPQLSFFFFYVASQQFLMS